MPEKAFLESHSDPFENLPFKFRKAGRGWCGGARETH